MQKCKHKSIRVKIVYLYEELEDGYKVLIDEGLGLSDISDQILDKKEQVFCNDCGKLLETIIN